MTAAVSRFASLRRRILGDDRGSARLVAESGAAHREGPEEGREGTDHADERDDRPRRGEVPALARHEGPLLETDRDRECLLRPEVCRREREPVDRRLVLLALAAEGRIHVTRELLIEPVPEVHRRADLGEGLCPVGAVDVPVELVGIRVVVVAGHMPLRVLDDIRLLAAHVVVAAEGEREAVVALRLVLDGVAVLVGDRDDLEVGRMPVMAVEQGADDAAVLVELGEDGDDRLHRAERRMVLRVPVEEVVGVEARELEIVDIRLCRRDGCDDPQEREHGDGETCSDSLHAATITRPCAPHLPRASDPGRRMPAPSADAAG
jgi:hypothetical protein